MTPLVPEMEPGMGAVGVPARVRAGDTGYRGGQGD